MRALGSRPSVDNPGLEDATPLGLKQADRRGNKNRDNSYSEQRQIFHSLGLSPLPEGYRIGP
jgi:hypothetical protein